DALAFEEQPAHRGARALGSDQDYVDVLGWNHAGLIAVDNAETVRKVECLAGTQKRLQAGPLFFLAGVRQQILHDRAALGCLVQAEQRLAGEPAVLLSQIPASSF